MRERMVITMVAGSDISEAGAPLLDDVVTGSVDFKGLPARRSKSGCWKSVFFIIVLEAAERVAYFGISSNLISYLTGKLGQPTAAAAENVNAWKGMGTLLPLLGAFVADCFLGRYRTIIIASAGQILGLGLLSLSAALRSFSSSDCKYNSKNLGCSPSPYEVAIFFFSLYLLAFAQSGHKPCVQAFAADQFDEEDEEEIKAKSSFFNWWNFSMCGVIFVSRFVVSYIQENLSWELGFGIPCILMCFALIVFLLGSMTYRFRMSSSERNPFVRIGWVFVKAARNWLSAPTVISNEEAAQGTVSREADGSEEDENVCSIGDSDDAKAILRLVPVWFTCLGYTIVYSQYSTLFTEQGSTMDRSIHHGFQIPAASLQSLKTLSAIVLIPMYEYILVPTARTMTKKPAGISMLQRIGTGIFLSVLCMIVAALVERQRLATAAEHGLVDKPNATVPMSVWWLAPQYLLLGIADVFATFGLQEFFYDQVPTELKSIGLALFLSVFGIGNFLSSFLVSVIEKATSGNGHDSWFPNNLNRAHLDYFYWLLTGLSTFTMVAYFFFAQSYIYISKGKVR